VSFFIFQSSPHQMPAWLQSWADIGTECHLQSKSPMTISGHDQRLIPGDESSELWSVFRGVGMPESAKVRRVEGLARTLRGGRRTGMHMRTRLLDDGWT
jgi:hypothetical protein